MWMLNKRLSMGFFNVFSTNDMSVCNDGFYCLFFIHFFNLSPRVLLTYIFAKHGSIHMVKWWWFLAIKMPVQQSGKLRLTAINAITTLHDTFSLCVYTWTHYVHPNLNTIKIIKIYNRVILWLMLMLPFHVCVCVFPPPASRTHVFPVNCVRWSSNSKRAYLPSLLSSLTSKMQTFSEPLTCVCL